MIIEFTWALEYTVAAVVILALENTEATFHAVILLEFVDDVILTIWHFLLVLRLARVKVSAHYHTECPLLTDSRILCENLLAEIFGEKIFN